MRNILTLSAFAVSLGALNASAEDASLQQLFSSSIKIERDAPSTSTSVDLKFGKLFIDAAVNGKLRQFIFDTGSPTILSREFADILNLEVVGRSTGIDAHGAEVTMDVAVLDSISIGGVTFRRVPVLIFDFSDLSLAPCLVDGGVIGSEILPGSAWRIDLQNSRLGIAESPSALNAAKPSVKAPLYDVGYPHAPIVGYKIGDVADRALFDTGSVEYAAMFAQVFDDRAARASIARGSTTIGRGSQGESAGGRAKSEELIRFELTGLELGKQRLGALPATIRTLPPTLLGAGFLANYIVTLDFPNSQFLLDERDVPAPARTQADYAIAFKGETARVVQLFDPSAARSAGLKLDDRVVEIDGMSFEELSEGDRCRAAAWLAETFDASAQTEIIVQRDGRRRIFKLPSTRQIDPKID